MLRETNEKKIRRRIFDAHTRTAKEQYWFFLSTWPNHVNKCSLLILFIIIRRITHTKSFLRTLCYVPIHIKQHTHGVCVRFEVVWKKIHFVFEVASILETKVKNLLWICARYFFCRSFQSHRTFVSIYVSYLFCFLFLVAEKKRNKMKRIEEKHWM